MVYTWKASELNISNEEKGNKAGEGPVVQVLWGASEVAGVV